jgi:hypothetical protein
MIGITEPLAGADVADLGSGNNAPEQQIVSLFEIVRDEMLRAAPWNFATQGVELALSETSDGTQTWWDQWTFAYEYPEDALFVWCMYSPAGRLAPKIRWKRMLDDAGDPMIFTDLADARALIVRNDATDADTWTADFSLGLSSALAAYLAMPLRSDLALQGQVIQIARQKVAEARIAANLEGEPDGNQPCKFEIARWGYVGTDD